MKTKFLKDENFKRVINAVIDFDKEHEKPKDYEGAWWTREDVFDYATINIDDMFGFLLEEKLTDVLALQQKNKYWPPEQLISEALKANEDRLKPLRKAEPNGS